MTRLLLFLMLIPTMLFAQTRDSMVTVPASMLSSNQITQLQAQSLEGRLRTYGRFAGMGEEIGKAVNGTLAALNDNTAKFAETKVGKVAIALVVWKVIGEDIRSLFAGILIALIGYPILIWSFYRTRNPIDEILYNEKGKKVKTVYQDINRNSDGYYFTTGLHIIMMFILTIAVIILIA